ncbi:MAG: aldolase [Planctomycetes bacterium RBG_16_43_13]|nr:MAG: aldolase [Planctomycetes bacterium RBG_16_43_13]
MEFCSNVDELKNIIKGVMTISKDGSVKVEDAAVLRGRMDKLVQTAVFCEDTKVRDAARWLIRMSAMDVGVVPSSIQGLYEAMGRGEVSGVSVPAINVRGLTYDVSRAIIRTAKKNRTGAVIFEIAKSEIGYTAQRPAEYATVVMAAALKEGFTGPLFIQGDHFQFSAKNFAKDPQAETKGIKDLAKEAVDAGFFNIDIDSSTLVDLSKPTVKEQQRNNFEPCAEVTKFIRDIQPKDVTISVGGEIGEVGGKNSTVEEFRAFMDGYREVLDKKQKGLKGISKISVQTGTTHGGVPLPDGSIAQVEIDFNVHEAISNPARKEYGLCGTVQHGASTLPEVLFDKFPKTGTAEIHLATEFQNMIYEHPSFPRDLKERIYSWLRENCKDEFKPNQTDEQNIYKTRKKAFGLFKKDMWSLDTDTRNKIGIALEQKFDTLFRKLNVINTASTVSKYVKLVRVNPHIPDCLL